MILTDLWLPVDYIKSLKTKNQLTKPQIRRFLVADKSLKTKNQLTKPQIGRFLVADLEVINPVHAEILGDLEVLHLCFVPRHRSVVGVPHSENTFLHLFVYNPIIIILVV